MSQVFKYTFAPQLSGLNLLLLLIFYLRPYLIIITWITALSEQECELWIKGLYHLVNDTVCAPYPLQVERWLRKEFYIMENSRETLVQK